MQDGIRSVEVFLKKYEQNCKVDDMDLLMTQFADLFQVAGAHGTRILTPKTFAEMLPKRRRQFEEMGCGVAQLVSIKTSLLDERYALARTRWRFIVGQEEVTVESSFLIEDVGGDLKIVLYIAHDDLKSILGELQSSSR